MSKPFYEQDDYVYDPFVLWYPDPVERQEQRILWQRKMVEMKKRAIEEDRARLGHEPDYS